MKIPTIIVDDEPVARKILREFAGKIDFLELKGEAEDPIAAMPLLEANLIKLMFLDIQMPRISGINFLRTQKRDVPLTVVTTAYPNYAVEGFELDILDYLVKPIAFDRFSKACHKALQYLERTEKPVGQEQYFFVKCDNRIERIEYDELYHAEAMENYVVLHTRNGKRVTYLTLKGLLEHLPQQTFIKVHKSFVVNVGKVKSIEGNELIVNDVRIPLGQSTKTEVMQAILKNKMISR